MDHNRLYFAHYSMGDCGCTITARDLSSGKKLWETRLRAAGECEHSVYANVVTMQFLRLDWIERMDEGVIVVNGCEGSGDYSEVLDQKTGEILAHKIYLVGYAIQP